MTSVDRIQGLSGSIAVKAPCRVTTTAAISLSGLQTVDGVSVVSGDRVLVKDQATPVDNGIWIVSTAAWTRAPDFDGANDCVQGTLVIVVSGTVYAGTAWRLSTVGTTIPGTSSLTFEQSTFSGASSVGFLQAGTGAVARTVQAKERDIVSIKDFGAVGDGVTDDTAEITAALAAADRLLFVPDGSYLTTLAAVAFTGKTVYGTGEIILTGGQRLATSFSHTSSAPATWNTPGDPALAFAGESNSAYQNQSYIVGAATASQPTTGYFHASNLAQASNWMYNASGYNHSTSGATGRTAISQQSNYLIMAGQGDAFNFYGSGYIGNPTPSVSSHWLADPAVTVLAGGSEATTNSVNIVGAELQATDNGHEVTMSGYSSHIYRTVTPSPNPKAYVCVNFGATSNSSAPVDAFYYGAGESDCGIDFSAADFSSTTAWAATKANQYWFGNATNTSIASTPEGTTVGASYMGFQSVSSAWVCVNNYVPVWRAHDYGFVITNVPLFTQSGRVKGVRVVTASGAVTITAADEIVIINKSSGAATAANLFPIPATGAAITIKDGKGDANSNNITITPSAGTIDGAATLVINTAYGVARLIYNGTQWNVV